MLLEPKSLMNNTLHRPAAGFLLLRRQTSFQTTVSLFKGVCKGISDVLIFVRFFRGMCPIARVLWSARNQRFLLL
jgi:hypothetical protein